MQQRLNYSPVRRVVRFLWTAFTFVLAFPLILLAGIVGAVIGLVKGLNAIHCFWYVFRSAMLNAVLRVLGPCLRLSTRLYCAVFGHQLYGKFPLPAPTNEFFIVGHRGSPTRCCENTLHSYDTALREGANAIEIDLCLCKDGEVVIWHDWDPDHMVALFRESGLELLQRYKPVYGKPPFRRPVPQLTLTELRTHCGFALRADGTPDPPDKLQISTYREFLEWAVQQRKLRRVFLDMKIPPNELHHVQPMMSKMIADYNAVCPGFDVVFMTIYPEVFRRMKELFPEQLYCFDKEITNTFVSLSEEMTALHSPLLDATRLGNKIGSVGRPTFMMLGPWEIYQGVLLHDLKIRQDQKLAIELISWTINDPAEQKWLVEAGVDGILTDLPKELAVKALRRKAVQTIKSPLNILRHRQESGEIKY